MIHMYRWQVSQVRSLVHEQLGNQLAWTGGGLSSRIVKRYTTISPSRAVGASLLKTVSWR